MDVNLLGNTDPERIMIDVLNATGAVITTGMGVCLAAGNEDVVASADGISAVLFTASAELRPAFIGVAKSDIAANEHGLVIGWGLADSVLLSQETDKTIGVLAGASLLGAGGLAGSFTSIGAPETISTYMGKYVVNVDTVNISSSLPYAKALIRCI